MAVAERPPKTDADAEAKAKQAADDQAELQRLREELKALRASLPQAPKAPAPSDGPQEWVIEVEAYNMGTYGANDGTLHAYLRYPGDRFKIKNESHFCELWMRRVGDTSALPTSEVPGHGQQYVPAPGVPITGVRNEVKDPVRALNDLAKLNGVR